MSGGEEHKPLLKRAFRRVCPHLLPKDFGSLVFAIGYTAVCWTFLYLLYRKNVFLRA